LIARLQLVVMAIAAIILNDFIERLKRDATCCNSRIGCVSRRTRLGHRRLALAWREHDWTLGREGEAIRNAASRGGPNGKSQSRGYHRDRNEHNLHVVSSLQQKVAA